MQQLQSFNRASWAPSTCYTCMGALSMFIIKDYRVGRFHFCRRMRPLLIYTPHKHYEKIYDVPGEELQEMLKEVRTFMWEYMGTENYQIQNNHGTYSSHKHLHIKIACDEAALTEKRDEHFKKKQGAGGLNISLPRPIPSPTGTTALNLETCPSWQARLPPGLPRMHAPRRSMRSDNLPWRRCSTGIKHC
jgi:hypothetical protein